MTDVKTIDIQATRWTDRQNGNTYHSGNVTVNFGMDDAQTFYFPFHYGYEDAYVQTAFATLLKNNVFSGNIEDLYPFSLYCRENNIVLNRTFEDVTYRKDMR